MDKSEIEKQLKDSSILKPNYNEQNQTCTVTMTTYFVLEDNYIGFAGY